ncbi:unnamed protein product [Nezara viridula]|uniref:Uncharacterized protein n=1 Tax=Nezara viridula TaxID=85310 RepID=A0A9P0HNN4_NEZVI|nr:unnamed protein product [Nezara viridula]
MNGNTRKFFFYTTKSVLNIGRVKTSL